MLLFAEHIFNTAEGPAGQSCAVLLVFYSSFTCKPYTMSLFDINSFRTVHVDCQFTKPYEKVGSGRLYNNKCSLYTVIEI